MATQRITIAKIAGEAGLEVLSRFERWGAARREDDSGLLAEQWPEGIRHEMNGFALRLLANAHKPPVMYFSEYIDMWSMGNLVGGWMSVENEDDSSGLYSGRFELLCYTLPDGGVLEKKLSASIRYPWRRKHLSSEDLLCINHLREAVAAWTGMVDQAVIVALRDIVGDTVFDEQVTDSLMSVPDWLAELGVAED